MENSENIATTTEEETTDKVEKNTFKFKNNENGQLLTVHHTIKENDNFVRIRLVVGCFNETNRHFVTIDNRGNIFIFDLAKKKYWKLVEKIPKACIVRNVPNQQNVYLIGTRDGLIYWLDADKSAITRSQSYSTSRISNVSFPGIPLSPLLAVVHSNHEAILLNLETFEASHRLEFNQSKISLKFVSYVPQSDQIFTCFTNDSVHIWSGITLNTIRVHNPIRIRDRYLMTKEPQIVRLNDGDSEGKFEVNCEEIKEFSKGLINSFAFSVDGAVVCFTTLDNYIIFLSCVSYLLLKTIKLSDATLNACWLFSKPNEQIILCQTTKSQLILLDVNSFGIKLIVEGSNCFRVDVSKDRELLYAIKNTGEANIYSVAVLIDCLKSTQNCVQLLRTAMTQPKAISIGCFDNDLRKMLTKSRLIPILREYGQYPSKYRNIIWTALIDVPCNKARFLELVKMGTHPTADALDKSLHLKDATAHRNLIKIFSCLGYWTKVFGHSDFLPGFIFPFVKVFSNNLTVCFEILATILTNQCQLWFEFHPLEPLNYLGMCENILNHLDSQLGNFYTEIGVTAKEYAWAMLKNGFSEVLDDDQWFCLWDNVLSSANYFLLFCAVAYNIVQRESILRMTSKEDITDFFREQNAIDTGKWIKKAYSLMDKCPSELHPRRYMKEFVKLPKGVYPKFQNYPKKWVDMQETEMGVIRKEQKVIDERIRDLERDEAVMMERLERGLQEEEYSKRMKDMQKQYQEILKREEERVGFQRKMLILYQKEIRQRKGKVVELLDQLSHRKKQHLQENEMDTLLGYIERGHQRNEMDLTLAEENIKDQELMLLERQYEFDNMLNGSDYQPMRHQFREEFDKLAKQKQKLTVDLQSVLTGGADEDVNIKRGSNTVSRLEARIQDLENEFQTTLKTQSKQSL